LFLVGCPYLFIDRARAKAQRRRAYVRCAPGKSTGFYLWKNEEGEKNMSDAVNNDMPAPASRLTWKVLSRNWLGDGWLNSGKYVPPQLEPRTDATGQHDDPARTDVSHDGNLALGTGVKAEVGGLTSSSHTESGGISDYYSGGRPSGERFYNEARIMLTVPVRRNVSSVSVGGYGFVQDERPSDADEIEQQHSARGVVVRVVHILPVGVVKNDGKVRPALVDDGFSFLQYGYFNLGSNHRQYSTTSYLSPQDEVTRVEGQYRMGWNWLSWGGKGIWEEGEDARDFGFDEGGAFYLEYHSMERSYLQGALAFDPTVGEPWRQAFPKGSLYVGLHDEIRGGYQNCFGLAGDGFDVLVEGESCSEVFSVDEPTLYIFSGDLEWAVKLGDERQLAWGMVGMAERDQLGLGDFFGESLLSGYGGGFLQYKTDRFDVRASGYREYLNRNQEGYIPAYVGQKEILGINFNVNSVAKEINLSGMQVVVGINLYQEQKQWELVIGGMYNDPSAGDYTSTLVNRGINGVVDVQFGAGD
jgi:hypothetical protein